jgi:uncharacterized protein (DUF4415 family)
MKAKASILKLKTKPLTNKAGEVRSLTRDDFRGFRPAREVLPELVADHQRGEIRKRGKRGPQKKPTKQLVSIRLSQDVLSHFRASGEGWQTRLDDALRLIIRG